MKPGSSQGCTVMGTQWYQSHTTMRKTLAQYRDKNVTSRGMQHGDTLLKEDGGSPSLEVYKVWLDKALGSLLSL